ncbi:MAG: DNA polymerase, partial [Gammaproteobacteria bacterium]|nr:DNA polymerase [Gammaproteobacteria bacterium]
MLSCEENIDVLVDLWKAWFTFLDENDLGNFGPTVGRQAFNAYRHRFMSSKIGIHRDKAAVRLERAAYRGGRTECFQVGHFTDGPYYKLDVNSMYAAIMLGYSFPKKLISVIRNVKASDLARLLNQYSVIAEVVIQPKEPIYPKRMSGRNSYPTGTFMTTLTSPELRRALENDEVRGVGEVAFYESARLFTDYISFFAERRQWYKSQGSDTMQEICKLLMNSLQGKFGQKGHEQEVVGYTLPSIAIRRKEYDALTGDMSEILHMGGSIIRQTTEGEGRDS